MLRRAYLHLFILCILLCVAACGREAPPRVTRPTAISPTPFSTQPQPAQALLAGPERRALGDPNAPITVIEYGDYQ